MVASFVRAPLRGTRFLTTAPARSKTSGAGTVVRKTLTMQVLFSGGIRQFLIFFGFLKDKVQGISYATVGGGYNVGELG